MAERTQHAATPAKQVRVFINYRRADTGHAAGRLRDMMVTRFGERSVFVDVEDIEPGADYVEAIDGYVSSCVVMLVLIGDEWLAARDRAGHRRIDDPADRLRLEVESGLRNRTRVIPVLVDGASMPKTRDLPESLVPLSRHQSVRVRHETFRADAEHLIDAIANLALESGASTGAASTAGAASQARTATQAKAATEAKTDRKTKVKQQEPSITTQERHGTREPVSAARWAALALLALALLVLVARTSALQGPEHESRLNLPEGAWPGSLIWLLPGVPMAVAAWLVVVARRAAGVALGSIGGAALWVLTSLVLVLAAATDLATLPTHLLVLALLLGAAAAVLVAEPALRVRPTTNHWDRIAVALLWMVGAVALRAVALPLARKSAGVEPGPLGPPDAGFWLYVVIAVLICVPAALLALDREQARTLRTMAILQLVYLVVLRSLTFAGASGSRRGVTGVLINDALLLGAAVCVLLAVRAGQRGAPRRGAADVATTGG